MIKCALCENEVAGEFDTLCKECIGKHSGDSLELLLSEKKVREEFAKLREMRPRTLRDPDFEFIK